uniref:(northern house mosquito) hypothetical protein n=1 Tax=Culex pipiens TaxID=7175 RepID=A0A8D8MSU0_CULPI
MLGSCRILGGSARHSSSDASVTSLMGTTETVRLRLPFFLGFNPVPNAPWGVLGSPLEQVEISPAEGDAGERTIVGEDADAGAGSGSAEPVLFRRRRNMFNLSRTSMASWGFLTLFCCF